MRTEPLFTRALTQTPRAGRRCSAHADGMRLGLLYVEEGDTCGRRRCSARSWLRGNALGRTLDTLVTTSSLLRRIVGAETTPPPRPFTNVR